MNITITGAGNMGLAITSYLAINKNHNIVLYSNNFTAESILLKDYKEKNEKITKNFTVTSSKLKAFKNADLILCTYPAFLRKNFIDENKKYFKNNTKLGFIPGYGGAEYFCNDLIEQGVTIFGFQRVPYVARANKISKQVEADILSKKNELFIAAIPNKETNSICALINDILDIPCIPLREYLSITLVPSNPLLHSSGLYNVFKRYKPGTIYDNELKFYEEWDDNTSELLLKYDNELQEICRQLSPLDLSEVVPLRTYYESPTAEMMTKKLKSIESFKAVMVPLKKIDNGYIPDFDSRMFVEDFPYGVCVIKSFAIITGTKTPIIDLLLNFYKNLTGLCYFNSDNSLGKDSKNTGIPLNFGILNKEDILNFYHR